MTTQQILDLALGIITDRNGFGQRDLKVIEERCRKAIKKNKLVGADRRCLLALIKDMTYNEFLLTMEGMTLDYMYLDLKK